MKKPEKYSQRLSDLCDNNQQSNMYVIGVQKEMEKEKKLKK